MTKHPTERSPLLYFFAKKRKMFLTPSKTRKLLGFSSIRLLIRLIFKVPLHPRQPSHRLLRNVHNEHAGKRALLRGKITIQKSNRNFLKPLCGKLQNYKERVSNGLFRYAMLALDPVDVGIGVISNLVNIYIYIFKISGEMTLL